jgi:hypothetical protein
MTCPACGKRHTYSVNISGADRRAWIEQ